MVIWWVYQRYFRQEHAELLRFEVQRGNIQEVVRIRGEVAAQKEFDLEFPFSGIVEQIFIEEGQSVEAGQPLIKLDTVEMEIESRQQQALLEQHQANLDKLLRGATVEDIRVYEVKLENAKTGLLEAEKTLKDAINDAYTKADDAVRNKTDQLFKDPRSPLLHQVIFLVPVSSGISSSDIDDIEKRRFILEESFGAWQESLEGILIQGANLHTVLESTKQNLRQVKAFLDEVGLAVNGAEPTATISQSTLDTWRSSVSAARTNIDSAISNITSAEEGFTTAKSSLSLAESELELKKAGTRQEEIDVASAQVKEAEARLAAAREHIRKSTLFASVSGRITKLWLEPQEIFRPGQPAVSLSTSAYKIQADVSELDIARVREVNGNEVKITLDAFPGIELQGKVVSVEPKEVIIDGDVYYRVNAAVDAQDLVLRPGMSADLVILVSYKQNVLKIPELAIFKKNNEKIVYLLEGEKVKEVPVQLGISDGEFIEIVSGLEEGQIVIVTVE